MWQCCDQDLEAELFKDVQDIGGTNERSLLDSIKKLAVISIAASVRRAEFLALHQDHGQPVRSFAARVKGKAQTCAFHKNCSQCDHPVDYTDEMVKYVIISGIADEEIKKEVLGIPDLDKKTLNDTVTTIENKEMASRAISSPAQHLQSNAIHSDIPKDMQLKLSQKSKCKHCSKTIQRYKLRRKGSNKFLKEFSLCIDCWKNANHTTNQHKDESTTSKTTAGALFDTIASIKGPNKNQTPQLHASNHLRQIDHYIFDGTYGWMIAESKPQPVIRLKIYTNKSDYDHMNIPYRHVKSTNVTAITDTGAQSSLMGMKTFRKCGFQESDLVPVKRKMYAANNEGITIKGAVFTRLSGINKLGDRIETAEMIYITDSTDHFYLSRRAMENLQIITPDFPTINAVTNNPNSTAPCGCYKRQQPPTRPKSLPFAPTDENIPKMREWLINRFSSSTFNKCTHQRLPMMSGPPIKLNINSNVKPSAVHTPAPIPLHWREAVKRQLDEDVRLGVIEKVEPNTATTWCHRAIWTRKPDGSPRRVVDFQSLNKHCVRDTHHTIPPFQQARSIPPNTYRTVTDAWNGYHSVPVYSEDKHFLTFITEFGRYRYCVAPQGHVASGDGYTHRYDKIITDIPRKTKCVDDTTLWDEDIDDHWWRAIDYLELMGKEGIVLNPTKFQFCQKDINFAGFNITDENVRPLDKYIDSIRQFPTPRNIADIRSWFGLINQVSHYSKLSNIILPFKPLLSPKTPFKWSDELQDAFEQSKFAIVEAIKQGVQIFDPKHKTCLSPDWSKTGIGYWLFQKHCTCNSDLPQCCNDGWKITLAGSRFLRPAEQRYAPIEGESLAIAWALEDTKFFTMGCDDLIVATDHKPLVKIFSDRALDEITNTRIFNLKQRTLKWRFKPIHIPGKLIPASDATSRNPAFRFTSNGRDEEKGSKDDEASAIIDQMEVAIVASVKSNYQRIQAVTWERVRTAIKEDPYMCMLSDDYCQRIPKRSILPPASATTILAIQSQTINRGRSNHVRRQNSRATISPP